MNRSILIASFAGAALACAAAPASADCTISRPGTVVTYWSGPATAGLCDTVNGTTTCHLQGWLYEPSTASAGSSPAVVYVTDNDRTEGAADACQIVNYFVAKGYVVFTPYERGVTDNSPSNVVGHGFHSTGTYIDDYDKTPPNGWTETQAETEFLGAEAGDLTVALTWLRAQTISGKPLVNSAKVAVFGHGHGGVLAMLANASTSSPLAAVVDLSGASIEWNNGPEWATLIDDAVTAHTAPILLQDVANLSQGGTYPAVILPFMNDHTAPDLKLALYMQFGVSSDTQALCTARSYGAEKCASYAFVTQADQIGRWLDTAADFIAEYGAK